MDALPVGEEDAAGRWARMSEASCQQPFPKCAQAKLWWSTQLLTPLVMAFHVAGMQHPLTWKEWRNAGRRWGQRWESGMATACLLLGQPQLGLRRGQRRVPVQCRQPVEKRSSISPRSPFWGWPAPSFLHKSLLQFMFSGREKNLCGEPWFQPRAEQGPPKDQFSFSAPAFHLCLPLAGERFCTWTLQSGPQCWELLST